MMSPMHRIFITTVIVADLLAVVYFGGQAVLTGSILPNEEAHAEAKSVVPGVEEANAASPAAAPAEPAFDLASYVADPVKGQQVAGKCKACHTFESGGPNRVGPNLFGIVGAPVTHKPDFSYSTAMQDEKTKIGHWDEKSLFAYLESPRTVVPGTKMQFNGISNPKDRADLIAWLKTLK
ncbi:MAG: c-type cytochrome [Proteobacteria bacterium]|nr:c-type cytochrome [Pseudomonadota bacterium]